jgi:sulfatase modifying factor 1
MKKTAIFFVLVLVVAFSVITGCKKNSSPSGPAATDVPTAAATAVPTATATAVPTPIASYTNLVSVPGGSFNQTEVTASFYHTISAFKMGKYQVTYDLWNTVYQWAIHHGYSFADAGGGSGYAPVTNVSWRDVIVWCNAYSQEAGLTPCYTYLSAVIKDSTNATACDSAVCVWANNGYRLPTEGEYQYAASYINGSNWTWYNYASGATDVYTNEAATDLVGWDGVNSGGVTHNVGGKTANALGIYDMSGNVWEWCWDWYGSYPVAYQSWDYRGPAGGSYRVLRGGSYDSSDASYLQVGYRSSGNPYDSGNLAGFRFARTN